MKITHTGYLIATPLACNQKRKLIDLRETKHHYVDKNGRKYQKETGYPTDEDWPNFKLDVGNIRSVSDE